MSSTGRSDTVVGRERELAAITARLHDLVAGAGAVVWVEGEPGIGKSAVLAEVARRAASLGTAVFSGGGDAVLSELPLRLMADCFRIGPRASEPELVALAGTVRGTAVGGATPSSIAEAIERLADFVEERCTTGPVAVIADDVHWADPESARLLGRLMRLTQQHALLLVCGSRVAAATDLRAAATRAGAVIVDLAGLDASDAAAFVVRRLGATPGPALREQLARAHGNPLFLRELIDAIAADGSTRLADGTVEYRSSGAFVVPGSLQALIDHRLSSLSPEATRVLETAAVLGTSFDPSVLAGALGVAPTSLLGVLVEGVRDGVLYDDGDEAIGFRHPLIWEGLVARTPGAVRRALHAHVAQHLAQGGADFVTVARHLQQGPARVAAWAVEWLDRRRPTELDLAPDVAADLLADIVAGLERGSARWERLGLRLLRLRFELGRDVTDLATALTVAPLDPWSAAEVTVFLARSEGRSGRGVEATDRLRRAAGDGDGDPGAQAHLLTWLANGMFLTGDASAAGVAAAARRAAALSGDSRLIAEATRVEARHGLSPKDIDRLGEALALLPEDAENAEARVRLQIDVFRQLHELGRAEERDRMLVACLIAAERWTPVLVDEVRAIGIAVYYELGRWDEALVYAEALQEAGMPALPLGPHYAAAVLLGRGEVEQAAPWLTVADAHPDVRLDIARLKVLTGEPLAALQQGRGWLDAPLPRRVTATGIALLVAGLALDADDRDTAERVAALMAADAQVFHGPVHGVELTTVRALLADDPEGSLDAARAFQAYGHLPLAAAAYVQRAEQLGRRGLKADARLALNNGVALFEGFGAVAHVARADARLRAVGVVRGPRSRHRQQRTGWEALTPTENRVALLVAAGRSNPAIAQQLVCSRRTVETHVSNVMTKLGVRARAEVAAFAPRATG